MDSYELSLINLLAQKKLHTDILIKTCFLSLHDDSFEMTNREVPALLFLPLA